MAINRPVSRSLISTTQWGIPITDAVNANTDAISYLKSDFGYSQVASFSAGTANVMVDVMTVNITAIPVASTMRISGVVGWACAGSTINGQPDCYRFSDNTAGPVVINVGGQAANGLWLFFPIIWQWNVAANGNPGFKFRCTVSNFTGTAYVAANVNWQRFR